MDADVGADGCTGSDGTISPSVDAAEVCGLPEPPPRIAVGHCGQLLGHVAWRVGRQPPVGVGCVYNEGSSRTRARKVPAMSVSSKRPTSIVTFAAVAAASLIACGPSYTRGASVVSGNTTVFYPDPELASDAATIGRLKAKAESLGCTATVVDTSLVCNCKGGSVVFSVNPEKSSVFVAGCQDGFMGANCAPNVKLIAEK